LRSQLAESVLDVAEEEQRIHIQAIEPPVDLIERENAVEACVRLVERGQVRDLVWVERDLKPVVAENFLRQLR
jgi:hypothetical protein